MWTTHFTFSLLLKEHGDTRKRSGTNNYMATQAVPTFSEGSEMIENLEGLRNTDEMQHPSTTPVPRKRRRLDCIAMATKPRAEVPEFSEDILADSSTRKSSKCWLDTRHVINVSILADVDTITAMLMTEFDILQSTS